MEKQTLKINLDALSNKELAALYNAHAETPVKRFSDRAAALRRTQALLDSIEEQPVVAEEPGPDPGPTTLTTEEYAAAYDAYNGEEPTPAFVPNAIDEEPREIPPGPATDLAWPVGKYDLLWHCENNPGCDVIRQSDNPAHGKPRCGKCGGKMVLVESREKSAADDEIPLDEAYPSDPADEEPTPGENPAGRKSKAAVKVRPIGDPEAELVEYSSVLKAFEALGLPIGKHQKFRRELKLRGVNAIDGHTFFATYK